MGPSDASVGLWSLRWVLETIVRAQRGRRQGSQPLRDRPGVEVVVKPSRGSSEVVMRVLGHSEGLHGPSDTFAGLSEALVRPLEAIVVRALNRPL